MAIVQLTLPDDLAQRAVAAGLLSAEASQEMLQERLQRRAGESLREIHRWMASEELTEEIQQQIIDAVQAYRAKRVAARRPQ